MPSPLLPLAALAARVLPERWRRSLYRLGPVSKLIRSTLNRAAAEQPEEVLIAAGDLVGARFVLNLRSEKSLWLGTYEPEVQAGIRTFAAPAMTAYDVGANLGYTSLLLARAVGIRGKVIAFEPEPRNLVRLAQHIARNPEGSRITVVAAAIGARSGTARLQVHPSTSMGKLMGAKGRAETYGTVVPVPLLNLDAFVARGGRPPQILKIDVEGAEGMVLVGMRRILSRFRPLLLLELHGPEMARLAWRILARHDYEVLHMQPGYPTVAGPGSLPWKAYVIAIPRAREGPQTRSAAQDRPNRRRPVRRDRRR